jgi:hypothetical protein
VIDLARIPYAGFFVDRLEFNAMASFAPRFRS